MRRLAGQTSSKGRTRPPASVGIMTMREAAEFLHCPTSTLYGFVKKRHNSRFQAWQRRAVHAQRAQMDQQPEPRQTGTHRHPIWAATSMTISRRRAFSLIVIMGPVQLQQGHAPSLPAGGPARCGQPRWMQDAVAKVRLDQISGR
jgi:hypothetical protein